MEIDLKTVGDLVLYMGAVATAMVAIAYLFRRVVLNPLKTWIKEQVGDPVQEIHQEVTPNSATDVHDPSTSSMKDDLAGVRESVDALTEQLTGHIEATAPRDWRITALEMRVDGVEARVNEHIRSHPGPADPLEGI